MKNSEKASKHTTVDVHATIVVKKMWLKKKQKNQELKINYRSLFSKKNLEFR